jgi:hypothetical protein
MLSNCTGDNLNGTPFNADAATTQDPFECPEVFAFEQEVEIDNGIFVTCDELKPFYQIIPVGLDA